jgi:cell division protein FtsB
MASPWRWPQRAQRSGSLAAVGTKHHHRKNSGFKQSLIALLITLLLLLLLLLLTMLLKSGVLVTLHASQLCMGAMAAGDTLRTRRAGGRAWPAGAAMEPGAH